VLQGRSGVVVDEFPSNDLSASGRDMAFSAMYTIRRFDGSRGARVTAPRWFFSAAAAVDIDKRQRSLTERLRPVRRLSACRL
jgi:hypothetical protein